MFVADGKCDSCPIGCSSCDSESCSVCYESFELFEETQCVPCDKKC
jgi:hypothetical protein